MSDTQYCGHPMSATFTGDEGTSYCAICEREAREKWADDQDAAERRCQAAEYAARCMNCEGQVEAWVNKDGDVMLRCDEPQAIGSRGCGWEGRAEND